MDHSSENHNVTVIHTDLDHLEIGEEDGNVIELANEMDEAIGMKVWDRTTGKQTFGKQFSSPGLQQKAKLSPILHVIPGEWDTNFVDHASDAEPKVMDVTNKDLDKEREKELKQMGLRLSELQAEVEPPGESEHQPYTALQTQNIPESHVELFSLTTMEQKVQSGLSALEHQPEMEMAGPVEKDAGEKLAILCKDTKTRVSIKMNDMPKEHSEEEKCVEKTAEQEVVVSSKVRIMDSPCQAKRKTLHFVFNNDATVENNYLMCRYI